MSDLKKKKKDSPITNRATVATCTRCAHPQKKTWKQDRDNWGEEKSWQAWEGHESIDKVIMMHPIHVCGY